MSNTQNKTNACATSAYMSGDQVLFQFEGLLVGRVERVHFEGRKVRYQITLAADCEVPEGLVVGLFDGKGGEAES